MRTGRRRPRRLGCGAAALIGLACACGGDTGERSLASGQRPNVLLIVVDTLRRDHLGAYGYPRATSPHIDRLAASGVRYERAISQAPWTTPSMAALLTSRHPTALGITHISSALGDDLVLLSEVLQRNGYTTGAVVSHKFCSARWNFDQGFDFFDDDNALGHDAVTSPSVTDKALEFLASHTEEDFFLWLHYFDPHFTYIEHPGFSFAPDEPYQGPLRSGMTFRSVLQIRRSLRAADLRELRRVYDAEIAFTDHHIGRVLDGLLELGLFEETLVVFTADHGEEFMDHGRLGHTKQLYDEVVAVPLIVRIPGRPAGVVNEPVALLDVYPTILDAVGLPVEEPIDGISLLAGPAAAREERTIFSATERPRPKRAVLDRRFKLIQGEAAGPQLYDLAADPLEQRNRVQGAGPELERLRAALLTFEHKLRTERGESRRIELSEDEVEQLRALGYDEDRGS